MWPSVIEPLVEYGVGRFVSATSTRVSVEEPLALIGILRYLEDNFHTLEGNVTTTLRSDNQGLALEQAVLLALTKLLQNQGALKEIFAFHGQSPLWADQSAQIVACNSSGKFEAFSIVTPTTPSSIVAFSAKTPDDVTHWLKSSDKGWCIPCSAMGPDLSPEFGSTMGRYWFWSSRRSVTLRVIWTLLHQALQLGPSNLLTLAIIFEPWYVTS